MVGPVRFWAVGRHPSAPFPLTLTLSPKEREQPPGTWKYSLMRELSSALRMVLPLPKGEGGVRGKEPHDRPIAASRKAPRPALQACFGGGLRSVVVS